MPGLVKHCDRHPDRRAIGVCVVTGRAICRECSTQYQGVNYSREGLEQLLAEERRDSQRVGRRGYAHVVLMSVFVLPGLYLAYTACEQTGQLIIDLLQWQW